LRGAPTCILPLLIKGGYIGTSQESVCSRAARLRWPRRLPGITVIVLLRTVVLANCTYFIPLRDDAKALQEQLKTGEALQPDDHVRVVTEDGVSRKLFVASVEADDLKGYLDTSGPVPVRAEMRGDETPERKKGPVVDIPIADRIFVENENLSTGKTAAAVGGGTLVFEGSGYRRCTRNNLWSRLVMVVQ
jgi:hypothetical protein